MYVHFRKMYVARKKKRKWQLMRMMMTYQGHSFLSLWRSPRCKHRPQSSFFRVSDIPLCRIYGEGRRETKAMWVWCSHVRNLGRVNLTWVLGPCIMHRNNSYIQGPSAGLGGNAPSTLVHVEWKQTHKKNEIFNFYSLLFTFFRFIYTSTDIKPLVVVWNLTRYLHFCSSVLCLWNEITPFSLWLVTRHTEIHCLQETFQVCPNIDYEETILYIDIPISTYVYRHGKAK